MFSLASTRLALRSTLSLAAMTMLLSACGDDPPGPGSLEVRYVLGPDRTCDELGITTLALSLEGTDHESFLPCDDAEARILRLDGVAPGSYEMRVQGLDADGIATMDNGADDPALRRVRVAGDDVVVEAEHVAELTVRPAQLQIAIDFKASSCAGSGMGHLEIRAYDETADILLDAMVVCDDSSEGFIAVDDELRALKGSLFSEMTIQPISRTGELMGPALNPGQFAPVGPGRTIWVELLDCTSEGCPESAIDLPEAD